jgi:hypothetical protein
MLQLRSHHDAGDSWPEWISLEPLAAATKRMRPWPLPLLPMLFRSISPDALQLTIYAYNGKTEGDLTGTSWR